MVWFSFGVALLVSAAIITIGAMYILNPRGATKSFGLPLPEAGANIDWWLRLKGIRDIVSGLILLAIMAWGSAQNVGIVMLMSSLIPVGDMFSVLAAKGSATAAWGIHGLTAALMLLAAVPLIVGVG